MDKEREKIIGGRLRAFRETLQIPRTKFALTIGIGSERLAAYESGRAALPYAVFLAASENYGLSPGWLASGDGSPKNPATIELLKGVPSLPRQLFSEVFDSSIKPIISKATQEADQAWMDILTRLKDTTRSLKLLDPQNPEHRRLVHQNYAKVKETVEKLKADLALRQEARTKTANILIEKELTDTETSGTVTAVKPQLPDLLERLKKATAEAGQKTALAKFLDVPLASVSRWLSGEREPGGEVTLKMLQWVQRQERK